MAKNVYTPPASDVYDAFHIEPLDAPRGTWCVVHTATDQVCHTGLTEEAAREIVATMREGNPTDL